MVSSVNRLHPYSEEAFEMMESGWADESVQEGGGPDVGEDNNDGEMPDDGGSASKAGQKRVSTWSSAFFFDEIKRCKLTSA